jgi:hypothetical protein
MKQLIEPVEDLETEGSSVGTGDVLKWLSLVDTKNAGRLRV